MRRFSLVALPLMALGLVMGLVSLTTGREVLSAWAPYVILAVAFVACLYSVAVGLELRRQQDRVTSLRRENAILESQCRFFRTNNERLEVRLEVLTVISQVARVASSGSTFEEMIEQVLELLQGMLGSDEMVLYAVSADGAPVAKVRKTPSDIEFLKEDRLDRTAYADDALSEDKIIYDCVANRHVSRTSQGDLLAVAVPLVADGGTLGALKVTLSLEGTPLERAEATERYESLLEELSRHLGLALKKTKLEDLSNMDALTGLLNKGRFLEVLEEHFAQRGRRRRAMALAMIDIDHFKQVNDTYGHRAGDAVLAQMGRILKATFRKTDQAFRYGGEELAVVLDSTNLKKAHQLADRLRARVARHKFRLPDGNCLDVTVSLGVAATGSSCPDAATLVDNADSALYQAKRSGRNAVCVFPATLTNDRKKPARDR